MDDPFILFLKLSTTLSFIILLRRIDFRRTANLSYLTAYWIAFGPHGPRAQPYPPGTNWWILKWVSVACLVSGVIFWAIRQFARGPPKTLNAQWEEMTNEYLRVCIFPTLMPSVTPSWPQAPRSMKRQVMALICIVVLQNQKVEPITGLSSEGYKGKGQVQSPPRKGGLPEDDDE